jgi:hypothetical protein
VSPSGVVEYRWHIIFDFEVHVILVSPGDYESDRPHWLEVIRSIKLLH